MERNEDLKDYNEVGFIGGEFFDGQLNNEKCKNISKIYTFCYKILPLC